MTFINEYVSEEKIKKYKLKEVKLRFNPAFISSGLPTNYKYQWTIDGERNIYLMEVHVGRDDLSNRITWVLNWNGQEIKFVTDSAEGGSLKLSDSPYIQIWDLISITPEQLNFASREQIIYIFKEALTTFGYACARRQIPNTIIKFNF